LKNGRKGKNKKEYTMKSAKILTIFAILLGAAFFSYAQDIPLVEPRVENGIRYITGGVGIDEREAMREALPGDYNLKIVLAAKSGPYLSNIPVRIADAAGNVLLETDDNGPWIYVDLPSGKYTVSADYNGNEKRRVVSIDGGMDTVFFHWKYDGDLRTQID
jgi:hypothetical protein